MRTYKVLTISAALSAISLSVHAQTATGQVVNSNKSVAISTQLSQLQDTIKILQNELTISKNRISALESAPSDVPTGTVAAFDLSACPTGWNSYDKATGRSIVGSGSFDATSEYKNDQWNTNTKLITVDFPDGKTGGHIFRHLNSGMQSPHQHVVPFGENAGHDGYNPRWGYAKDIYPYKYDASNYTNQNGTKGHDNDNEWMMTSPMGALSAVKPYTTTTSASASSATIIADEHYTAMFSQLPRGPGDTLFYHKYKTMEGTWFYKQYLNTLNPYIALKYCKKD